MPEPPFCFVPGCDQPRDTVESLCTCEEPDCPAAHDDADCCKRHSSDLPGRKIWQPNDGILDDGAIDIAIHGDRTVRLTWVEALIVVATMLAAGLPLAQSTRQLGFDPDKHPHGILRGPGVDLDLKRAIAAIRGEPPYIPPPPRPRKPRRRNPELKALRRAREAERIGRKRAAEAGREYRPQGPRKPKEAS